MFAVPVPSLDLMKKVFSALSISPRRVERRLTCNGRDRRSRSRSTTRKEAPKEKEQKRVGHVWREELAEPTRVRWLGSLQRISHLL